MQINNMLKIALLSATYIFFAAFCTLVVKFQNVQVVDPDTGATFFHPFVQTLCMCFGEALVGFGYIFEWFRKRNLQRESLISQPIVKNKKPPAPQWILIFPGICDLTTTLLSYVALNLIDSSVWQITRGASLVVTAILARIFLKQMFNKTAIFACFLVLLGTTAVQVVTVIHSGSSGSGDVGNTLLGILFLVGSITIGSFQAVIEKWLFNKYELSSLKLVFMEGTFGTIIMIPLIIAFRYVHCPWKDPQNCVAIGDQLYLQSFSQFWEQVTNSLYLLILNITFIVSITLSVPVGMSITKNLSPVSRAIIGGCGTVLLWMVGIVFTLTLGRDHHQYKLESIDPIVNALKAAGFAVQIVGMLMYHRLLPCQEKAIVKKEEFSESLLSVDQQTQ